MWASRTHCVADTFLVTPFTLSCPFRSHQVFRNRVRRPNPYRHCQWPLHCKRLPWWNENAGDSRHFGQKKILKFFLKFWSFCYVPNFLKIFWNFFLTPLKMATLKNLFFVNHAVILKRSSLFARRELFKIAKLVDIKVSLFLSVFFIFTFRWTSRYFPRSVKLHYQTAQNQ